MCGMITLSFFVVCAAPVPEKLDAKKILEALQGEWVVEKAEADGKEVKELKGMTLTIDKTTITAVMNKEKKVSTFKMDVTKTPMEMDDFDGDVQTGQTIFELDGDRLRMCGGGSTSSSTIAGGKETKGKTVLEPRPTKFDSKQGIVVTLKRAKK